VLVDILIVLFLISSVVRGREIGFVRQLFSAIGFFGGLIIGVLLQQHFIHLTDTTVSRAVLSLLFVLGSAMLLLSLGEYIGVLLKRKLMQRSINNADALVGAVAGGLTLLITIWLVAPVLVQLPFVSLQKSVKNSVIIGELDSSLPSVPNFISRLGRLIDPNGFPQVFSGLEPGTSTNVPLPNLGEFTPAVKKVAASVVKIEGRGCGGIVEGSGFVSSNGFVVTNAHVVAGVSSPYIIDNNGQHQASAVWFDPNLDLAVLHADNLAGAPLTMKADHLANNSSAAVLGYPGGGNFSAKAAKVLDEFMANGRNIYDEGSTVRDVYEVKADIIPGNSGGPLIDRDGTVRGVVFAQSTTYDKVGYALAMQKVISEVHQAEARNQVVATGNCTAE
jgi:S1-C subfamily serine protease